MDNPSPYASLGTPGGYVEIVPYNPQWPAIYAHEAERIMGACHGILTCCEHIGSTAVPGLAAKPIIDIMPGIAAFADGLRLVEPLAGLGYAYFGENGIPGRHYFHLRSEERTVMHVHVMVTGSENWQRHLLFRDYLRAHPETARVYAELKHALALKYRSERGLYADNKSTFINAVVEKARQMLPSTPGSAVTG